ncbi:MAG: hypothetical protein ACRCU5_13925 [Rhizobiaceae bacterium]
MKIAYGLNRREKDFAGLEIVTGKYFIDTDTTDQSEREAMLHCVSNGVTVVVLSMVDLGRGAGQVSIVKAIDAAGGKVLLVEGRDGPPATLAEKGFTADQEAQMCRLWGNKALSEATRLVRIQEAFGHPVGKAQVYYICVTKPKRVAKRQQKI